MAWLPHREVSLTATKYGDDPNPTMGLPYSQIKLWGANSVVLVHKQTEIFPHIGTGSQKITYFKFVIKCFYYLLLTYWTAAPLVLTLLITDVFCYPLFYVMLVKCMCNRR